MDAILEHVQTLEGHSDRVWYVCWSPKGDMLASCSGDKTVRIWTRGPAGDWRCSAVLEDVHSRTVRSCSFSPDSRYVATASFDRTSAIWHLQGGVWEHVAVLEGHENEVKRVAWSPSGELVATCGRDRTVWLWESQPGNEYEVVDVKHGHSQDVKSVAWHPHGELLASTSYDDTIKIWVYCDDEWICGQTLAEPAGHTSTVWEVAFAPDGRRMVSCSDDLTLKVWGTEQQRIGSSEPSWQLLATLSGYHERTIFSVDWSSSGLIATAAADNAIRIFAEAEPGSSEGGGGVRGLFTGRSAASFHLVATQREAHPLDVNCVRWHPSEPGLLASAGDDGAVRLWRLRSSECDE